jgi:tetratricopeptide (TPR) repeat protein
MKKIFLFVLALLFMGCSAKKVTVNARMPAEVDALAKKRVLAVIPFKNDRINFTGRLQSALSNVRVDNRPFFVLISRNKIKDILRELKFQSSDLVGEKNAKFGRLIGAEVLITGNVGYFTKDGRYLRPYEICVKYHKKRCLYYKRVYEECKTSVANLDVTINAIDVSSARILDSYTFSKTLNTDGCKSTYVPSRKLLENLINEAVDNYVKRVAPHEVLMKVELIDSIDSIDLSSKEEKMFENAITYIEHGRLKKAEYLLKFLNYKTHSKSYEIAYDIGVVEEALGNYEQAKAAYELADKIILKRNLDPSDLVDKALKRINFLISQQRRLKAQVDE